MGISRTFRWVEHFESFQGEGKHSGRRALFLRLYGCNLKCAFCDEPLHKDIGNVIFEGNAEKSAVWCWELIKNFCATGGDFIVITGGEPSMYAVGDLIVEIRRLSGDINLTFAVESNGYKIENLAGADHITISPKRIGDIANFCSLYRAEGLKSFEFKIPYIMEKEDECASFLTECYHYYIRHYVPFEVQKSVSFDLWLTPINGVHTIDKRNNEACRNFIESKAFEILKDEGMCDTPGTLPMPKICTQLHKFWGVR